MEAVAGEVGSLRTSTATVKLEIIDTNDNSPQFSQEVTIQLDFDWISATKKKKTLPTKEYHVEVAESIRYPEALLTVHATDKDSGKFGQILYYVSGDGADIFVIEGSAQVNSICRVVTVDWLNLDVILADPGTGVVRVAPNVSLDREKQPSYTFTVIAADQPQGSQEQKRSSVLVNNNKSPIDPPDVGLAPDWPLNSYKQLQTAINSYKQLETWIK